MTNWKHWMLLLVVAGATGCSKDKAVPKEEPKVAPANATPSVKASPVTAEGVVAAVNGVLISRDEFLRHIEPYPDRMKETAQGREYVLQALVDQILLEDEARRKGLDRDPEYVRKVESYRRNLLTNLLLQGVSREGFEVTASEAQAYFDAHPEEFDRPERVQARHILLSTQEEASRILAEIRAGASFEKMAVEHSRDSSSRGRGGDLGVFAAKQRPDLAEAAFGLNKRGQVAGPVQTQRGFHLVQLVKRLPAEKQSFVQVRENLMTRLRARKRQESKLKLVERLRESGKIDIHSEELARISIPTDAP